MKQYKTVYIDQDSLYKESDLGEQGWVIKDVLNKIYHGENNEHIKGITYLLERDVADIPAEDIVEECIDEMVDEWNETLGWEEEKYHKADKWQMKFAFIHGFNKCRELFKQ